MKNRFTFHTLVLMVIILTFSISFVSVAQQNPVQTEAETATAEDINTMRLEAKATAERDASEDVNKLLWFGAGLGTAAIGSVVGGCMGCLVGTAINPEADDYFGYAFFPNTEQVYGCLIGAPIGCLMPLIGVYSYAPDPLATQLIGKSPEYVEFYIDVYKSKTRSIRTKWAAAGSAVGGGIILGYFLAASSN